MNSETRVCKNCSGNFQIDPDDFAFYETIKVPPPTWCPQCRLERRMLWQGYRVLFKRTCDFSGESVISTFPQDAPHIVYKQDIWWSDKWDPKSYGKEYDFNKSFFEQFQELLRTVPLPALRTDYTSMTNSEYCNAASNLKNCYLCFRISGGEESAYVNLAVKANQSFDCFNINHSELCYESINIGKSSMVFFSHDCEESHDIWYSRDLVGCSNCIGCVNLRNKTYYAFNKPISKEEYKNLLTEPGLREQSEQFILTQPRRQFHGIKNLNVSGDYISNSKNVKDSYMLRNGENLRYCQLLKDGPAANSYDWTLFGDGAEWMYDSCWSGWAMQHAYFCSSCYKSNNIQYCFICQGSSNLFGCIGIRSSDYCILNKQYSKEEYLAILPKIKEHMMRMPYKDKLGRMYGYGEMFPPDLAVWAYNNAVVYEWFPKTKDEVLAMGFPWRDEDKRDWGPAHDDILKCVECGRNYQYIQKEIDFHKRFNLTLPDHCPLCRDRARILQLNPMVIYHRDCAKCSKDIETSYSPDRPEIVYCEQCYQQEVA